MKKITLLALLSISSFTIAKVNNHVEIYWTGSVTAGGNQVVVQAHDQQSCQNQLNAVYADFVLQGYENVQITHCRAGGIRDREQIGVY